MPSDALVSRAELTINQEAAIALPDGRTANRWTFGSPEGVTAEVFSLGARLQALHVPDRHGRRANVVLHPGDEYGSTTAYRFSVEA